MILSATPKLELAARKSSLKRIFSNSDLNEKSESLNVKEEPAFAASY